jgi:hypothetical protein
MAGIRGGDLSLPLKRALRLLCAGDIEYVFQLAIHLIRLVDGGRRQGVQQ